MPKKPDLSKAFGERFKTEDKVEVQDPIAAAIAASKHEEKQENIRTSPDANINVGTQDDKNVRMHARTPESLDASIDEKIPESVPERKPPRKQTGKQVNREVFEEAYIGKGVIIEVLYDQIQQKKHLSNGSFRYKADELEKLDAIFKDLEAQKPGRISKNDIARMALIAFYEDYEKNGEDSILAQVFRRM